MPRSSIRQFATRSLRSVAVVSAACLAILLTAPNTARAQGLFQAPSLNATAGTAPQGVAAADFARSGYQSLVVSSASHIEVYLASPTTGALPTTPTAYSSCTNPTAVIAADVNNDGYPDILVACPSSNYVDLYLNQGAGVFTNTPVHLTVTDPVALVAGDFDNSGTNGVAVANGSGGVTTFLDISSSGAGSTHATTVSGTLTGIAAGDFNQDGDLDLAVSDSKNNNVHILTGNGDGTFPTSSTVNAGSKPSAVATADFNNDGDLDLAVTNAGGNTVSILRGNGNGTFNTQANPQSAGLNPIALSVTDVNNDGFQDVIVYDAQNTGNTAQNAYLILLGNGNGTLQVPQTLSLSHAPGTVAAVADFNRDGKPDLAFVQQSVNQVSLLVNNTLATPYPGGRSFSTGTTVAAGSGNFADSIATGDFNQDGKLDVAVAYLQDNAVRVLQNTGGGSFTLNNAYSVGNQPYFVASADLNSDGYPDLVTVNTSYASPTGTISVLLNKGKGNGGAFNTAVSYPVGKQPYEVAIGDLNGDGYPDLAVTNNGGNTVSIYFGSKAGTFTAQPSLQTCASPYGIAIGDFENNGRPSIAVTCYYSNELEVFFNQGNGTFGTSPAIYDTDINPGPILVGDFTRNGNLDIVVGNTTANDLYFFKNTGNNTFATGVESPSLNFPVSLAAGDVNGDGIPDIVAVAPNFNSVAVALGVGDGTFGNFQQRSQGEFTAKNQPWGVALGDFSNNGRLDIVTANTIHQVNLVSATYQIRYLGAFPAGSNPAGTSSVDLLANQSRNTISLGFNPGSPLPANNTGTTITATVAALLGGNTPTGSVQFQDSNGNNLGTNNLNGSGTASYTTGRLGSGAYSFTALYSGDQNFQPTTFSSGGFTLTVSGTPVNISLNTSSVQYGAGFTATVTAVGNATTGGYPHGSATIYAVSSTGATSNLGTFNLNTVSGNNNSVSVPLTAVTPLDVGSYELYATYNKTTGNYASGSSSSTPLTVTVEPTTLSADCFVFFIGECGATVNPVNGDTVNSGVVNFYINGSTTPITGNVTGSTANIGNPFTVSGTYTVQAVFVPAVPPGDYVGSTATITLPVTCINFFGFPLCFGASAVRSGPVTAFNAFSGTGIGANNTPSSNNQNNQSNSRNVRFSSF